MSRVSIIEAVPGNTASSSDENTNLAAWNTATASIDDTNVRNEGLDHGSFADEVVECLTREGAAPFFESSTKSGAYTGAGPFKVTMGGNDVQIGPIVVNSGDSVLIYCSAMTYNDVGGGTATLILQYNPNSGVWSSVGVSRRSYIGSAVTSLKRRDYTVAHLHSLGTGTFYYRLAVEEGSANNTYVENAVLYAIVVAH